MNSSTPHRAYPLFFYVHIHMDGLYLSFPLCDNHTRLNVFLCCRIQLPQQSILFSIFRLFSNISLSRQVHSIKSVAPFTTFHWRIFIRHTLFSLHQSVNLLSRPVFLHPFPKFSYPTVFVTIIQTIPSLLLQPAQWIIHFLWYLRDKILVISVRYSTPRR